MAQQTNEAPDALHATAEKILRAATQVFAKKGFDGARIDAIAAKSKINKQRLYHYFGNKDALFTAVLEHAYRGIREAEAAIEIDDLPADRAILRLVEFTWAYYQDHPEFIRLLNSENQLEARHLKASTVTRAINTGHNGRMQRLIARGKKEGTVRSAIDPMQLSVNIAALAFFYLMNRHTLSVVFERELVAPAALNARLAVMKDTIQRWIAPT